MQVSQNSGTEGKQPPSVAAGGLAGSPRNCQARQQEQPRPDLGGMGYRATARVQIGTSWPAAGAA